MTGAAVTAAIALLALLALRRAVHAVARRGHWRIGALSKVLPGWKDIGCGRCGTSWKYVAAHATPYKGPNGPARLAPLCQRCWEDEGTPQGRVGFYVAEIEFRRLEGERFGHDERAAVLAAVAAGL